MAENSEVLIVGAGPSGLFLSLLLAQRGISCRLIDEKAGPSPYSRALALQARTLEIFDKCGIVEEFLAEGLRVDHLTIHMGKKARKLRLEGIDSPYPFVLFLPQSRTEAILTKYAVPIEWNTRFVGLDGTNAVIERKGTIEKSSPAYIIGCDGAHSKVREALHISFEGVTLPETFFLADVTFEPMFHGPHTLLGPQGLIALLPVQKEPPLLRMIIPGEVPQTVTTQTLNALLAQKGFSSIGTVKAVTWTSHFSIHRKIATHFGKGPLFLVGDAAHIHSPVGGQGMNTGLQDAFNLAWKLALSLRGRSGPALLLSYETERTQIAKKVLRATTLATKMVLILRRIPLIINILQLMHRQVARAISETTLSYKEGFFGKGGGKHISDLMLPDGKRLFDYLRGQYFVFLLFEPAESFRKRIEEGFAPWVKVVTIDTSHKKTSLLIRPDGVIAERFEKWSEEEAWMRLTRYLTPSSPRGTQ